MWWHEIICFVWSYGSTRTCFKHRFNRSDGYDRSDRSDRTDWTDWTDGTDGTNFMGANNDQSPAFNTNRK